MKLNKLIGIGLIALSTCGGFTFLESEDEKEQLVIHLTNPAKPGKLSLGIVNGDIHVIGYDGKDVIIEAIAEEKRIKGGSRKKKEALINRMNPEWKDLYEQIKLL